MIENHRNEIYTIAAQYQNVIKPLIITIEVLDSEYPIEVLNELRAIMDHISRSTMLDNEKRLNEIDDEIRKAKGHLKRAILDCFKYLCISYNDAYETFMSRMKNVDLSMINNGDFSLTLSKLYVDARAALKKAKMVEQDSVNYSIDEGYQYFETAFLKYEGIYAYIEKTLPQIEKARHKQAKKQLWTVLVGTATILGLILAIVFRFL